jgi:hypothetical protein
MPRPIQIGLRCEFTPGGFSGQRVALIRLASGDIHKGLAPLHYCWDRHGHPLRADEPAAGQTVEGIVAARRLQERAGQVVVSIPDGDVLVVPEEIVTERPASEISPHVPV